MSSLLSPFHFGQKHAYFHVNVTIHELTNLPLVEGQFSCKWVAKGHHSLAALQNSAAITAQQHGHGHGHVSHLSSLGSSAPPRPNSGSPELPSTASSLASFGQHSRRSERSPTDSAFTAASTETGRDDSAIVPSSSSRSLRHSSSRATLASTKSSLHLNRAADGYPKSAEPHRVNFFTEVVEKIKAKHGHHNDHANGDGDDKEDETDPTPESAQFSANTSARLTLGVTSEDAGAPRLTRRGSGASRRTTNSTKTSASKISKKAPSIYSDGQRHDAEQQDLDPLLVFSQEPKGETDPIEVEDNAVKWETSLQVGIKVPIDRARPASSHQSGSSTPSQYGRDASERNARSARSGNGQAQDGIKFGWGSLLPSELKISVRQGTAKSTNKASMGIMKPKASKTDEAVAKVGHIVLNLAEYAPEVPSTGAGRDPHNHHHHAHQQHHHNHHVHHHHHGHHLVRPSRTETRRYLLAESKTNATLKVTVEMTFVGGAREYVVPPLSKGLLAGGLSQMMDGLNSTLDHYNRRNQPNGASRRSSGSDSSSLRNDRSMHAPLTLAPGGANQRSFPGSKLPSGSSLSLPQNNTTYISPALQNASKRKVPNRIPSRSLISSAAHSSQSTKLSHKGAAFAFSNGANQDRPTDDVISAIFTQSKKSSQSRRSMEQSSTLNGLLSATVTRSNVIPRGGPALAPPTAQPSGTRQDTRSRKVSTASNLSKKSDRSFSFGCGNKNAECAKAKAAKKAAKEGISPTSSFKALGKGTMSRKSDESTADAADAAAIATAASSHSLPSLSTGDVSDAQVSETAALSPDSGLAVRASPPLNRRNPSIRLNIAQSGDLPAAKTGADDDAQTPMPADASSDPNLLKPPSVVVGHAYVPIRAGDIQTASHSDLDLGLTSIVDGVARVPGSETSRDPRGDPESIRSPTPLPSGSATPLDASSNLAMGLGLRLEGAPLRPRLSSHHSDGKVPMLRTETRLSRSNVLADDQGLPTPSSTEPLTDLVAPSLQHERSRKTSASDLRSTYRTQLPFASGLGSGAVVGLERIKKTSRAMGEYAKDKFSNRLATVRSNAQARSGRREGDVEGDEEKPKLSKGALGVEPTEAVLRGWNGAGWRLALEPEVVVNPFVERGMPLVRPTHRHVRQDSEVSVYYDLEDETLREDASTTTEGDERESDEESRTVHEAGMTLEVTKENNAALFTNVTPLPTATV